MEVFSCIKEHDLFSVGDRVAVAVSGGSDSMSLLHFLKFNEEKLGITVLAANVEHGIRGESSRMDTEFVKRKCVEWGVLCYSISIDVLTLAKENKQTVEQAARLARYDFFKSLITDGKCDKVATAHNLSDNAESVLMNIFRGAGLTGACGIPFRSENIIRPLLTTSKEKIMQYIESNGIEYVEDETNSDLNYTRNFIRHEIMPKIQQRYNGVAERIFAFSKSVNDDNQLLFDMAKSFVSFDGKTAKISLEAFKNSPIAARAIFYSAALLGQHFDIERTHINMVCKLCSLSNGSEISLPQQIVARREYDVISLFKPVKQEEYNLKFEFGQYELGCFRFNVEQTSSFKKEENTLYFKCVESLENAVIRSPKQGDTFCGYGGKNKTLNKFLSDKKVPLRLRENIPLIATENEILAVVGVEIAASVKVSADDKKIIKIKYKEI